MIDVTDLKDKSTDSIIDDLDPDKLRCSKCNLRGPIDVMTILQGKYTKYVVCTNCVDAIMGNPLDRSMLETQIGFGMIKILKRRKR